MPIQKCKPTSPGRRFVEKVVHDHLHKGAPYAPLVEAKKRTGGRNNNGHITTRHVGGGHKQHYRLVDFKRNKDGIPATVERIEYDPNRTAHIALVLYADGERRYIIAPKGLRAGDKVQSGNDAPIRPGNCLPLRNMPIGSTLHNIELKIGKGAQLARSAGTSVQLLGRDGSTQLFVYVLAKCVKFTLNAVQFWVKFRTQKATFVHSVKRVLHAGVAFVLPYVVWL